MPAIRDHLSDPANATAAALSCVRSMCRCPSLVRQLLQDDVTVRVLLNPVREHESDEAVEAAKATLTGL